MPVHAKRRASQARERALRSLRSPGSCHRWSATPAGASTGGAPSGCWPSEHRTRAWSKARSASRLQEAPRGLRSTLERPPPCAAAGRRSTPR
eukprot:136203-Alexandrium_andersonii.AAC.1